MRLLIGTLLIVSILVITLIVSQNFITKRLSAVKFDVRIPPTLNDNGIWGPKLNHERLLLRLENDFVTGGDSTGAGDAGLMNERWLDLGPALFYPVDTVEFRAEHHALFLLYAAESGEAGLFDRILAMIKEQFVLESGLLRAGRRAKAANPPMNLQDEKRALAGEKTELALLADQTVWLKDDRLDDIDYYASLIFMRALALAHQNWGEKTYLDALNQTSSAYLAEARNDLPPLMGSQLEVLPTPPVFVGEESDVTADLSPTPIPEDKVKELSLIRLADIDLYSLQVMTVLDPAYQDIFDNAARILREALREGLPVFAEAYDSNSSSYVLYTETAHVSLDQQVKIMLSLAEADLLPPESLAWLKSRLNNYELVETYSLQDVSMTSNEILPLRYGQICRLARLIEDRDLYATALDRLLASNISTVSQSPIYGLIFRHPTVEDDVRLTFADNVWALLGSY